jgi:hypothetical protein
LSDPAFITAAASRVLPIGKHQGMRLCDLDDATLAAVLDWTKSRVGYYELWCAAMITAKARYCRAAGLLNLTRAELQAYQGEHGMAARWLLEYLTDVHATGDICP